MKRFWIGTVLLFVLLVGGVVTSVCLERLHAPISHKLSMAAEAALEEDWQNALSLSQQAQDQWQRQRKAVASLSSHTPMEQIESLFKELNIYRAEGESLPFAACCASLSSMIETLAEAHAMNWWNLL